MPSTNFDKLSQLKAQLEQCNNETAALLLKRTIAKVESQLQIEQLTTQSAKVNPKAVSNASQKHILNLPTQNQVKKKPKVIPHSKTSSSSQPKSKSRSPRTQKPPLLPGNGTHRAWCQVPGIIRMQEPEAEGKKPHYSLEVEGHQLPMRFRKQFTNLLESSIDQPLMVKGYPCIIDGKIIYLQFCGAHKATPEFPENWIVIGVWNFEKKRILVQRNRKIDTSRRILQHSPLVKEICLEKLEGGKLYRFECQREGITVTIVGVEAVVSEEKFSDQAVS